MASIPTRREFLRTSAFASAALLGSRATRGAEKKRVLLFTKSSGFEHQVIKVVNGQPSIV
jgi:hypothetical protein